MISTLDSKFLAAQSRADDLRSQSATRNVVRAALDQKRHCDAESRLNALKVQVAALEASAASTWENQRHQALLHNLLRARGA